MQAQTIRTAIDRHWTASAASAALSIMEFRKGEVSRETQYLADPFAPPAWRAQCVEQT
jgi:hypothetical protein